MEKKSTYLLSAYDESGTVYFIMLSLNFQRHSVYFVLILQAKGPRPRKFKEEAYLESHPVEILTWLNIH